jgi:MYXO-CTERM domain-containing protein
VIRLGAAALAATLTVTAATSRDADAFCGFYVAGADAELFNNATQVVMMRVGSRTVLSMQNNYQGPASDFAMVVPVPVVLQKENVKTLSDEIFDRVDKLGAPRLVEYWEQDPCYVPEPMALESAGVVPAGPALARGRSNKDLGVKIEAQFEVGEYEVVILSAKDSSGLDTWLRAEKYQIPDGAEPYLRPYVSGGSKFFVAKVNADKVQFKDGQAMLSPLRFYYDTEEFTLPIRLGMMNSAGTQDLIVNILSPGQRYEVANYPNVTIPTNLDLKEEAKTRFGEFYAALFDRTIEKTKRAVVTEYAWDASTCDPCPLPALRPDELVTLGADVASQSPAAGEAPAAGRPARVRRPMGMRFVLTRLHARYSKGGITEDLVFKQAAPIAGGREWRGSDGKLEQGSQANSLNMFQARYAIRHPWTGAIKCDNPRRGIWGGPPAGTDGSAQPEAATDLAFAPRGKVKLAQLVAQEVPEVDVTPAAAPAKDPSAGSDGDSSRQPAANTEDEKKKKKGCGCQTTSNGGLVGGLAVALAAVFLGFRRRSSW